jgi:hypothetical protein
MKLRLGDLKRVLLEAKRGRMDTYLRILNEDEAPGDSQAHNEGASGDSLDEQVDRYLAQYEGDAKKTDGDNGTGAGPSTSQMERLSWRDLVKGVAGAPLLIEAGQGDKDAEDAGDKAPGADELTGDDSTKLGLDHLDVAKFADDVVRLIDNYDSLLEVRSTLMRRAKSFLQKTYDDEVQKAFDDVLRDDHGMEPGANKGDVNADKYPAPAADRASGSAQAGGGPAGG